MTAALMNQTISPISYQNQVIQGAFELFPTPLKIHRRNGKPQAVPMPRPGGRWKAGKKRPPPSKGDLADIGEADKRMADPTQIPIPYEAARKLAGL